ncbi:MAG TPA: aspartate ammonia-lyase, partial [Humibacter sp.]|nr:aspartate ammonia-lyase [Humibacter sp.]
MNTPNPILPTTTNPVVPDPTTAEAVRTETDSLGSREIPEEAYWGVHTSRAVENFPIAKRPISVYPEFIVALAGV